MIALKYFREKANLTQAQLADKIGISRSALAMWETGKTEPDISTLNRISDILNVPVNHLLINVTEWHKSIYEDFRKINTEEEQLIIFKNEGVPENMIPDYIAITNRMNNDKSINVIPNDDIDNNAKVALFGGDTDVTDEMWEEVKDYAKYIKQKHNKQ